MQRTRKKIGRDRLRAVEIEAFEARLRGERVDRRETITTRWRGWPDRERVVDLAVREAVLLDRRGELEGDVRPHAGRTLLRVLRRPTDELSMMRELDRAASRGYELSVLEDLALEAMARMTPWQRRRALEEAGKRWPAPGRFEPEGSLPTGATFADLEVLRLCGPVDLLDLKVLGLLAGSRRGDAFLPRTAERLRGRLPGTRGLDASVRRLVGAGAVEEDSRQPPTGTGPGRPPKPMPVFLLASDLRPHAERLVRLARLAQESWVRAKVPVDLGTAHLKRRRPWDGC